MTHLSRSLRVACSLVGSLALLTACADPPLVGPEGDFISHVPGESTDEPPSAGADAGAAGPEASPGERSDGTDASSDVAREIAEADIVQIAGDRLYALSQFTGMSIIDVSDPTRLRRVGHYRIAASPFEMYLVGDVAYVMFNSFNTYAWDEVAGGYVWHSSSRIQALNVADPTDIRLVGDHEVVGSISDSRLVGEVLYLVTYQDGWCWGCDSVANTRVSSFNIHDPATLRSIDALRFDSPPESWGPRSVTVTTDRMYVAGPIWADRPGSIQVVDISDPAGDLVEGAEVAIEGSIESRWQMDEHAGVLRVVSQSGGWRSATPPTLETFRIVSSSELVPLASLEMVLPRPEDLRSVRFDGDRAFAVTFEQTDPLFTFDLSDPAAPRQLGELEIPGWLYHMEPRGDRLFALGFDTGTSWGLNVSIFDVSDLTSPRMLDRVSFGGDWAFVSEDQDRVHKLFKIVPELGLILVPFGGGTSDEATCRYEYGSGIQLIDVVGDDLRLRGVAPQIGTARRALLHRGTLLGVTDNAVQAFDISDRDHPAELGSLEVARNISAIHVVGDHLLRFGQDWWTGRATLDLTATTGAEEALPLGEIDLSELVSAEEEDACYAYSYWGNEVVVHGDFAYLPRYRYNYRTEYEQQLELYVVDLRDRTAPALVSVVSVDAARGNEWMSGIVKTDHALLIGRQRWGSATSEMGFSYDVYDLSDPAHPAFTTRFEMPAAQAAYGWGYGPYGCGMDMGWGWWYGGGGGSAAQVSGDLVASQHYESLGDGSGRVRYFLDRLDVSDPAHPTLLRPINIPGELAHFDAARNRVMTLDYTLTTVPATSWEDCYWRSSRAYFDGRGTCRVYGRRLNVLSILRDRAHREDSVELEASRVSPYVAISDERVFFASVDRRPRTWDEAPEQPLVHSLRVGAGGRLEDLGAVELPGEPWSAWSMRARGARAFFTDSGALRVVDSTDPSELRVEEHEMYGWYCGSLEVRGDQAYCSMGPYGVLSVDL